MELIYSDKEIVVCVKPPRVLSTDEPGGLHRVLEVLKEADINVEYMYAFLGGKESEHAYMIFRVQDNKAAAAALAAKGIQCLDQEGPID